MPNVTFRQLHEGSEPSVERASSIVWLVKLQKPPDKIVMNPRGWPSETIHFAFFQSIHFFRNQLRLIGGPAEDCGCNDRGFRHGWPEKLIYCRIRPTTLKSFLNILAKLISKHCLAEDFLRQLSMRDVWKHLLRHGYHIVRITFIFPLLELFRIAQIL